MPPKYRINDTAFDASTDESAYWAGFLITDGCLHVKKPYGTFRLVCSLSMKDADQIEKLRAFLSAEQPARHYNRSADDKGGPVASLICRCPANMASRLIELGIKPRKTHTAQAPPQLVFNPHFWRGCIDGDGSVKIYDDRPHVVFCGVSIVLLEQFSAFVRFHWPEWGGSISRGKTANYVSLANRAAIKIVDVLYGAGGPSLDRKRATAEQIIRRAALDPIWCNRKARQARQRDDLDEGSIVRRYQTDFEPPHRIAADLSVNKCVVLRILKKHNVTLRMQKDRIRDSRGVFQPFSRL